MTSEALGLVLIASLLHAYWNGLMKKACHPRAFAFLLSCVAVIACLPGTIVGLVRADFPWQGWACVGTAGSLYAAYFLLLAQAYRWSDLSFAYPLARSVAPVLLLGAGALFLHQPPSLLGIMGVVSILAGSCLLQPRDLAGFLRADARERHRGALFAGLTGTITALYSLVDATGVRYVPPVLYVCMTYTVMAMVLSTATPFRPPWQELAAEWREHGLATVAAGILSPGSYLLVLRAMQMAPAAYVVALRSSAIAFSLILGAAWLGEKNYLWRWVGATCMMGGMVLIALRG